MNDNLTISTKFYDRNGKRVGIRVTQNFQSPYICKGTTKRKLLYPSEAPDYALLKGWTKKPQPSKLTQQPAGR